MYTFGKDDLFIEEQVTGKDLAKILQILDSHFTGKSYNQPFLLNKIYFCINTGPMQPLSEFFHIKYDEQNKNGMLEIVFYNSEKVNYDSVILWKNFSSELLSKAQNGLRYKTQYCSYFNNPE